MKLTCTAIALATLFVGCSTSVQKGSRFLASVENSKEAAKLYYPSHLPGNTGEINGTTRVATVNHPRGVLSYGPYDTKLKLGSHRVSFGLSVDNTNANNEIVAEVDVICNSDQNGLGSLTLARQDVRRKDFVKPFSPQHVHLDFTNPGCDNLEYRVIHRKTSYLQHHTTWVKKTKNSKLTFYPAGNDGLSLTGRTWGQTRYVLHSDPKNFLTYGPYTNLVKKGRNRVFFHLAIDNNTSDNRHVAWIDVFSRTQQKRLAIKNIYRRDFRWARNVQAFSLDFDNNIDFDSLEFRLFFNGHTYLLHVNTEVEYLDSSLLGDLWQRSAQFVYRQQFTFPEVHTSSLVVRNGRWYAFNRNFPNGKLEVVVRESLDKGKTWSDAFVVATPTPGTGYSEHVTDGSAYFDEDTGRGHTSTLYSQGYMYTLVEAASKSLACTKDQEWVVGLMRRPSMNQGTWEQYQQNPIIRNFTRSIEGCQIQYHKMFYDQGKIYVFFSYRAHTLHYKTVLYELIPGYGETQISVGN